MDELRALWRKELRSWHRWRIAKDKETREGSSLNAAKVETDEGAPFGAFLKPTMGRCRFPAAAREKIASDLAFEAGIHAVPVLLFESGNTLYTEQNECCVSLQPASQILPVRIALATVLRNTAIGREVIEQARADLSRIAVFDMWIGNIDRGKEANVVFVVDEDDPRRGRFVALDHSLSMGHASKSKDYSAEWAERRWESIQKYGFPGSLATYLENRRMLDTAEAISRVPKETIECCVRRIPGDFMDLSNRLRVIEGLIGRRDRLRESVLQYYP